MTLYIRALDRGGYSAHGGASYDPRCQLVILDAMSNTEAVALRAEFGENISSITKSESGITSTTPTILNETFTATLSSPQACGWIKYTVTLASGQIKEMIISSERISTPRCSDYGR